MIQEEKEIHAFTWNIGAMLCFASDPGMSVIICFMIKIFIYHLRQMSYLSYPPKFFTRRMGISHG